MSLNSEIAAEIVNKFKRHAKDSGSVEVQVALLTEKINSLSNHLKNHSKDYHSTRGLLMLVGRRNRMLAYLKSEDPTRYNELTTKLDLRKVS